MAKEKKYVVIDKSYLDSLLDKLHDITGENNPPKSFSAEELWHKAFIQGGVFMTNKNEKRKAYEVSNQSLSDFLTTKSL